MFTVLQAANGIRKARTVGGRYRMQINDSWPDTWPLDAIHRIERAEETAEARLALLVEVKAEWINRYDQKCSEFAAYRDALHLTESVIRYWYNNYRRHSGFMNATQLSEVDMILKALTRISNLNPPTTGG